jgi:hypothetical protein
MALPARRRVLVVGNYIEDLREIDGHKAVYR